MCRLARPRPGERFVDLVCGAAKPCLGAALAYPFLGSVRGIELLPEPLLRARALLPLLHQARRRHRPPQEEQQQQRQQQRVASGEPAEEEAAEVAVELVQGDILAHDWSDADIVFVCLTAFKRPMVARIAALALRLRLLFAACLLCPSAPRLLFSSEWIVHSLDETVTC